MFRNSALSYQSGSSFKPAFLFLKPDQRRALEALYGYARTIDDIADDGAADPASKEASLSAWRTRLEALFAGDAPRGRLETELIRAAATFSMSKDNLLLLLEGVEMDIQPKPYASFEDLKFYMYRVASAVGLSCLEIFGWRGKDAAAYAENLGYAVQLTNIIRDVFEDARTGRIYLPGEDLQRYGCGTSALKNSIYPENFVELMRFEAARARSFYSAARDLAKGPHMKSILSARMMDRLYSDLLDKLESGGFRTAGPRVGLNKFEKIRAVYRAWAE